MNEIVTLLTDIGVSSEQAALAAENTSALGQKFLKNIVTLAQNVDGSVRLAQVTETGGIVNITLDIQALGFNHALSLSSSVIAADTAVATDGVSSTEASV